MLRSGKVPAGCLRLGDDRRLDSGARWARRTCNRSVAVWCRPRPVRISVDGPRSSGGRRRGARVPPDLPDRRKVSLMSTISVVAGIVRTLFSTAAGALLGGLAGPVGLAVGAGIGLVLGLVHGIC